MREIYAKARFAKNSPLFAHEWQFWLGDLNYRIDLDRNEAKLAKHRNHSKRIGYS